jgi:outer membrane biosynthesis protein TonB
MVEEQEQEFNVWPMFAVKVKNPQGQEVQRKASDNMGLLQWMEMKEAKASIYNVDLDKIKDRSVSFLKAKVMEESWLEMKLFLQDSLGLLQKEQESMPTLEPEPEAEDETEIIEPRPMNQKPTQRPQQQQQPKPQPKQQPDDEFFESAAEPSDDEEIVL